MPLQRNRMKKEIHAITPKTPLVINKVGIIPTPDEKSTFQNGVSLIPAGLFRSHSFVKLFGPAPKRGFSVYDSFIIEKVLCHDGRASIWNTLNMLLIKLPKIGLMNINSIDIMSTDSVATEALL